MARRVLEMQIKLLGPEHPWVASTLNDVAWAAPQWKQKEAEALERESLPTAKLLRRNTRCGQLLYLVGDRARQRGNLKEAYPVLSAALQYNMEFWARTIQIHFIR
jgi:hypothetical protein